MRHPRSTRFSAFAISGLAAAALALLGAGHEADWYPSKYGKDDTIGAANLLSPELVKQAAKLVKKGKVYSLGVDTGPQTPAYPPRSYQIITTATPKMLGTNKAHGHDDTLVTWMGIGSQIDGLGHLGIDGVYYNGNKSEDFLQANGLTKLSTHKIPPIVTRGVVLDIAGLKGTQQLSAGTAINQAEIEAAAKRQKLKLRKGDVVLLHTGWMPLADQDPKKFIETQPGLGKSGAEYLAALGAVAVGADSAAVEVIPFETEGEAFPVHQILLAKNGVYLLENMRTAELVADGVSEFLFVLGQPKFVGSVQSVINPIAIR